MFTCDLCNYITSRSTDLDRHNTSKKHIMAEHNSEILQYNINNPISALQITQMCQPCSVTQNNKEKKPRKKLKNVEITNSDNIDDTNGYLYCMYNSVFIQYGKNCYKLGKHKKYLIELVHIVLHI